MEVSNLIQPIYASTGYQASQDGKGLMSSDLGQKHTHVSAAETDILSMTQSHLAVARQVMTQQVNIALEIDSSTTANLGFNDSHDYDSSKLVNNVLQKVHNDSESSHSQLSDDDHHQEVVKSVQVNVESGFQQSRVILNQIGIMNDSVASEVDQTESQVNQAIDQIAASAGETTMPGTTMNFSSEASSLNAATANREINTSLQITTQEGDVVTINLSKNQSLSSGSYQDSNGSVMYAGLSSESQLSIKIEGELSNREGNSIRKIVERVSQLAEKLFNGETADAMEKLSALNINSRQLSGIALNMSSNISYSAVSAYQQVSQMTVTSPIPLAPGDLSLKTPDNLRQPALTSTSTTPVHNTLKTGNDSTVTAEKNPDVQHQMTPPPKAASLIAVDLAVETAGLVAEVRESDSFENPFREVHKLFDQLADLLAFNRTDINENTKEFIKELFHDMVDRFEAEENGDETSGDD